MLIGLQLYSVRDALNNDFEGTLKAVSEMGYDGVEFAGIAGKSAEEVKALCKKYNLIPISAHVSLKEMHLKKNILIAGIIRAKKPLIPTGNDVILAGDKVIIIAADRRIEELSDILE